MSTPLAGRPARADARRNRDKLVAAAQEAFATAEETVSLERVARAAGVGIGTLYRHFPTREDLVEAVYGAELDAVAAGAAELLAELPPDAALRAWMDRYAAFVATKRGMLDTLRAGWASGRINRSVTRERVTTALGSILTAGARAGVLRGDVDPGDVTTLLVGALMVTGAEATPDRTAHLLDLVAASLRPTA
ncbi:TetR/AcrR family transcriptional regulator [Promicromonospora thailandica]|uniref:Transcriptional regulator, TetR family n=1 Tax=Promicromonospora thailandica TaxID=765201 RepID=A0A9X2G590_9MICO|nr:TetR/AcrR family transcriptional regulator [Promicromonospora thailandica]MCP2267322.1 transcriptional regulator, TetR family [Promicromonospora thailandica]BFF20819.1 TetR/AcrR family transcriptional regulator [Promicromonospora thailandica]